MKESEFIFLILQGSSRPYMLIDIVRELTRRGYKDIRLLFSTDYVRNLFSE